MKYWFNGQIYTLKKTLSLWKSTVFHISCKSPLRSSNHNLFIKTQPTQGAQPKPDGSDKCNWLLASLSPCHRWIYCCPSPYPLSPATSLSPTQHKGLCCPQLPTCVNANDKTEDPMLQERTPEVSLWTANTTSSSRPPCSVNTPRTTEAPPCIWKS